MRKFRIPLLSLVFALLALACQGTDSEPSAFGDEGWTVSPEPVVVIGGADEREGYLLQRVAGATRLSDGRIVIADGGSAEISFFDSLGTHLMTVGGEGEGPGEFRGVMQIQRLPGDTLMVLSRGPGLTWLSPKGDYVRSKRVNLNEVARLPCRIAEGNWHVLGDGTLVTVLEDNFGFDPCPPSADSNVPKAQPPRARPTCLPAGPTRIDSSPSPGRSSELISISSARYSSVVCRPCGSRRTKILGSS